MPTEERLRKCERQLLWNRRVNIILVCVVATVLLCSFTGNPFVAIAGESAASKTSLKEIRASAFLVVDEKDAVRARLTLRDGLPSLQLKDRGDKIRAEMYIGSDQEPVLALWDENDALRTIIGLGKDGSPLVMLKGDKGQGGVHIGIHKAVGAEISLVDQDRKSRGGICVGNVSRLYLDGQKGMAEVILKEGGPRARLSDGNGNDVWKAP